MPDTETWDVVPDLAVEVISESNSANAVARKIEEYFQAGVRQGLGHISQYEQDLRLRLADTGAHLQLGDELDGEGIIPGFHVPLSALFELEEEGEASDQPDKTRAPKT